MEWHPIETAPKDGTQVLGYFSQIIDPNCRSGTYDIGTMRFGGFRWLMEPIDLDAQAECEVFPTHWMPLPPPPT